MNRGLMGAFEGLGNGIAQAGQMMGQNYLEEKRLALQARIRGEERAENRAFKKEMTQENQEYKQGLLESEREYKDSNRPSYEDVTDEGGTLVGQRETGSNKYMPYANKTGGDMSDRQKLAVETKMSEIEAIRDSISDAGGVATDEQKQRMGRLNGEVNQIIGGVGGLTLEQLKNGVGGGQEGTAPQGEPEPKPSGIRGILNQQMQSNKQEEQASTIQGEVDGLLDEAGDMVNRLRPKAVPGNMGRPSPNAYQEPSAEDIQAGQALADRLIALDDDPQNSEAISKLQRKNIIQRIMELKELGVPINLDPKQ